MQVPFQFDDVVRVCCRPTSRFNALKLVLGSALLVLAACSDPTSITSVKNSGLHPQRDTWSCYDPTDPHCQSEPPTGDPDSTAAGIYLGSSFSDSACLGENINDSDVDGLDDFCEYQLALSFRPLLSISASEIDPSRESYFAAKKIGTHAVRLIYLFGYHQDNGNAFNCNSGNPFYASSCAGHAGDSEYITLELTYSTVTQHWYVAQGYLAAHKGESYGIDSSELVSQGGFDYPEKYGWYPRIYVARDKHGSYKSTSACDAGAWYYDTCDDNSDAERVDVLSYRNVGSSTVNFLNSTASTNTTLYSGTEYMWSTSVNFCGWENPSVGRATCSTPYGSHLTGHGF